MKIKNFIIFIISILFLIFIKIPSFSLEVKTLVTVNNLIITSQDVYKEKVILKYILNINNNEQLLNSLALKNLIDQNIKKIETNKNKITTDNLNIKELVKIFLKNNNKSLEDFQKKINDKTIEKFLLQKIITEVSWNQLIIKKFSQLVNINLEEILNKTQIENSNKLDYLISIEKDKKLSAISDSYFNEVKNKTFIKYQ